MRACRHNKIQGWEECRDCRVEHAARSLLSCDHFWKNAGTLPGEYDNLIDALKALEDSEDPACAPRSERREGTGVCPVCENGRLIAPWNCVCDGYAPPAAPRWVKTMENRVDEPAAPKEEP